MSFRTMTYVTLAPGVQLTDAAPSCLTRSVSVADERGTLIVYESYLAPPGSIESSGHDSTPDMLDEIAVQRFLDTLRGDMFYLKRVGETTCSTRGEFDAKLFGDEPDVEEIDAAYLSPPVTRNA
ncbi:hypothetical protein [Burkholderia pseudomallei]|uniref:hypothetical protein n=1 Tax=Burkholderia pseudomallei TaxID=28450 RepID=UPI001A9FE808|nr:hypothetical protein [Burkholderia pseudomallei]QTB53494.1 hypothetical protein J3C54_30635 [Burkholderia pseudomallei]